MELSDFVALRAVTQPQIDIEPVEIADIHYRGRFGATFRELVYVQGIFTDVTRPVSSYIIGYKNESNGKKMDHVQIPTNRIDRYDVLKHSP